MTETITAINPGAELTEALNEVGITTATREEVTYHVTGINLCKRDRNDKALSLLLQTADKQNLWLPPGSPATWRALQNVKVSIVNTGASFSLVVNGQPHKSQFVAKVDWYVTVNPATDTLPLSVVEAYEVLPEEQQADADDDEFEGNAAAMAAEVLDSDEPAIVDDTPEQKQALATVVPMLGLQSPAKDNHQAFKDAMAFWLERYPDLKASLVCQILKIERPGQWDWINDALPADHLVAEYFKGKEKSMATAPVAPAQYDTETGEVIDTALSTVTDALPIVTENEIAEQRLAQVKAKQAMLQRIRAEIMLKDTHYGIIQGTKVPTLLKPGAELLSDFFGLSIDTEATKIVDREYDWTNNRFYVRYRVALISNGLSVSAEGSCSSEETKYRWRQGKRVCPKCSQDAIAKSKFSNNGEEPGWYCNQKAGGCGAQFVATDRSIVDQQVGRVENPDKADLLNTLEKMSYKRAFVAAVLVATGASGMFTQDLEDNG